MQQSLIPVCVCSCSGAHCCCDYIPALYMARPKKGQRKVALFQPQQGWVCPRFGVQAAWQGAKLLVAGREEVYQLGPSDWKMLVGVCACVCLCIGGVGEGYKALIQAQQDKCELGRKPILIRAHGGKDWLQGAVFQGKEGYWQVRLPKASSTDIAVCKGLSAKPQLRKQAQQSLSTNVHHLITWWAHGRPGQSDYNQACHWYCGNKLCLNPHHLCWGSNADNAYHRTWHAERKKGLHSSDTAPERNVPAGWVSHAELTRQSKGPHKKAYSHKGCIYGKPCV